MTLLKVNDNIKLKYKEEYNDKKTIYNNWSNNINIYNYNIIYINKKQKYYMDKNHIACYTQDKKLNFIFKRFI